MDRIDKSKNPNNNTAFNNINNNKYKNNCRGSIYLNRSDISEDSSFILASEVTVKEEEKQNQSNLNYSRSSSNQASITFSKLSIIDGEEGRELIISAIDKPDENLTFWDNIKKNFSNVKNVLKFNFIQAEKLIKLEDFKELYFFGHKYSNDKHIFNYQDSFGTRCISSLKRDLIWFSYRNNFEAIMYGKILYSSDAGWGCMIRAGQMILAKAIIEYMKSESKKYKNNILENILLLFFDSKIPYTDIDNKFYSFAYIENKNDSLNNKEVNKNNKANTALLNITSSTSLVNNTRNSNKNNNSQDDNKENNPDFLIIRNNKEKDKNEKNKKLQRNDFEIREDYIYCSGDLKDQTANNNNCDTNNNKNYKCLSNKTYINKKFERLNKDEEIKFYSPNPTAIQNNISSKNIFNKKIHKANLETDYMINLIDEGYLDVNNNQNIKENLDELKQNKNKNLIISKLSNEANLIQRKDKDKLNQTKFKENKIDSKNYEVDFGINKEKKDSTKLFQVNNHNTSQNINSSSSKSKTPKYIIPPFSISNICDYSYKYSKGAGMWFSNNMVINILKDINEEVSPLGNLKIKHFEACLKIKEILNDFYDKIVCTCEKDTHLVEKLYDKMDNVYEFSDYDIIEKDELNVKSINYKCQCFSNKNLLEFENNHYLMKTKFLIFVSLRLGLNTLDPIYYNSSLNLLDLKHNIGIIGGKDTSAVYFIGKYNQELIYLDPHYVQESDLSVEDLLKNIDTYKPNKFFSLNIKDCTPSLTVGIFCADKSDYFEVLEQIKSSKPLSDIINITI